MNYINPGIEYDLASSTGPVWTLRELLALSGEAELEGLLDTPVSYTTAASSPELRAAIAGMQGVDAAEVQVVTGASEAPPSGGFITDVQPSQRFSGHSNGPSVKHSQTAEGTAAIAGPLHPS